MNDSAVLVHERLAIVDINSGEQPLQSESGDLALLVNGEILQKTRNSQHGNQYKNAKPLKHINKQ